MLTLWGPDVESMYCSVCSQYVQRRNVDARVNLMHKDEIFDFVLVALCNRKFCTTHLGVQVLWILPSEQYAMSLLTNPKPRRSDAIELVQARVRRDTEGTENTDDAEGTSDDDIYADVGCEGDGDKQPCHAVVREAMEFER